MNKVKKGLLVTIGLLSMGLGLIGVILPVLPTTPFLLLASVCFVKGSDRFDRWFKGTKLYQKHLETFVESKKMTLKQKWMILLFADFMLMFPFILIDSLHMRLFLILLILCKFYYFFVKIETIKN
ncbi:YbaN family protein [Turicibacter sanguinis]|uniref:YbaN family protein n=1 Tax=Turicibacter sanguinis TaxID=154288 RepID=UPI00104C9753|nr:YbaN family protein [Turicibacter sanguinis]MCU7212248.1 YbaN family protein [Turicibacter sanguinis]QJS19733.1 YbaN family protein [Turicibacter sanguinis]